MPMSILSYFKRSALPDPKSSLLSTVKFLHWNTSVKGGNYETLS